MPISFVDPYAVTGGHAVALARVSVELPRTLGAGPPCAELAYRLSGVL